MSDYREIYYTICPVGNATYIAVQRGFIKNGLEKMGVTPTQLQTLPYKYWPAHYNYDNDRLFREGGNTPPLWARSRGAEVVLIGLNLLEERQVFLVRKDSGIHSLEQLRGKRLAMPVHPNASIDYHKASAEQAFDLLLTIAGLAREDVEFVNVYSPDDYVSSREQRADKLGEVHAELDALNDGRLDVIFMKLSTIQVLLDTGKYEILYDLAQKPQKFPPVNNEYPNVLTVSRKLAEDRPEIVVEFVKQTLAAARWAAENRDEAEELLAQQTFGNLRQYRGSYGSEFYRHLAPNFSREAMDALENRTRFLYDHGYLERPVEIGEWADEYFLSRALDELEQGK